MELFWRLMLGHFIGDFTLQTNYLAEWKRRNVWGMLVHCAIHPVIYSIVLWNYMGQVWMVFGGVKLTGFTCVILIFVLHFIEDQWRVWHVLRKGIPDNTFFYFWDQVVHYAVLFVMSPVIGQEIGGKFGIISYPELSGILTSEQAMSATVLERFLYVVPGESWVFIGILFVIVTHFTTVTIYFVEKDLYGGAFPTDDDKYMSMAERMAICGCFFLPGLWGGTLIAIWLTWVIVSKFRNVYDFTWARIVIANSSALLCGILARIIIY